MSIILKYIDGEYYLTYFSKCIYNDIQYMSYLNCYIALFIYKN